VELAAIRRHKSLELTLGHRAGHAPIVSEGRMSM
jgi:hypothetical protein